MFTLKKSGTLALFILLLLAFTAGCGSKESAEPRQQTVTDGMGHQVNLPAEPKKIIASYLEDPLLALGIKPVAQWSVKGGSVQEYLRPQLEGIPAIPSNLPPETVLSFNPDLIILRPEAAAQDNLYEQYAKIAPTFVLSKEDADDYKKTLTKMAELLNRQEEAKKALDAYDRKAKESKDTLLKTIGDKKVAVLWLTKKNFYVVNGNVSSGAVLYGDLGLNKPNLLNSLPDSKANWVPVSLEKLAELDADYLFLVNYDKGQAGNLEEDLWKNIPAVKNGRVYEIASSSSWLYNGVIAAEKIVDDVMKALRP
ncbi:ABC transporter substrate-binding protein [Paenibacillus sp. UNC499MF]|uniref:ABC transporter substrate-binding protein n=1 Tax=Paenibacillus sp. UNC499MF TaxID=1502751 RepID=UPI0008A03963|nr:ABC transporter substrate-binding protein [Paenibacillus sp. UNC499MF]SEF70037.1 iron complex transport system substrate-binding protein [Paenibacillus sp. UNC499MF]